MRFSRIAAGDASSESIMGLLADTALEHSDADATAVVEVGDDGILALAACRNVTTDLSGWQVELDVIDEELGERLGHAAGFDHSDVLPLMSDGALFGALVLFYRRPNGSDLRLPRALAGLAAIALGRHLQHEKLQGALDEWRRSRDAQAHASKLKALGQMAAGVSHDLKNILNPLSIHLQLLARLVPKDNRDAHDSITEMKGVIHRGVGTIDQLRDFSRQDPVTSVERVELNGLVEEAVKLARARLVSSKSYHVALRMELGEPPPVRVQPSELVASIVNLVVNAIDAMRDAEGSRSITVRTSGDNGAACVTVEDDGPGMTAETAKRAFEPFFSTKGELGTGLGLSNAYASARRHGGELTLETAPGKGATFTISLPAARDTLPAPTGDAPHAAKP